jgi:putative oxidoreductase
MKTSSDSLPAYGAAILRVALGFVMLAHAAAKYFLFTLPGTAGFFAQHGFPGWTAYPVFLLEVVGGLLLVLGWQVRWISALLIPVMVGASFVHAPNGWMFTAPNGGWEYPVFLLLALAAQAMLGDGAWALSNRSRRFENATASALGHLADSGRS